MKERKRTQKELNKEMVQNDGDVLHEEEQKEEDHMVQESMEQQHK